MLQRVGGVIYHPPATFLNPPYNIILKNVVGSRGDGEKNVVGGRGVPKFQQYRPPWTFKSGTALSSKQQIYKLTSLKVNTSLKLIDSWVNRWIDR